MFACTHINLCIGNFKNSNKIEEIALFWFYKFGIKKKMLPRFYERIIVHPQHWFSNFSLHQTHLKGGLVKGASDSVGLRWNPRDCISKFLSLCWHCWPWQRHFGCHCSRISYFYLAYTITRCSLLTLIVPHYSKDL